MTPNQLIFSSGMSRRADFVPALAANHSIGVDISEMSPAAMRELAASLAGSTAHVFVDSGAFAAFRATNRGKPTTMDFAKVFAKYDALAKAVCDATDDGGDEAAYRVHYVMPDVVGDQQATLDALRLFADDAHGYHAHMHAIVPMQAGAMPLVAFFDAVAAIFGRQDLTIGVPSAAAAIADGDLLELLVSRPEIYGVHVLGAASEKRAAPRLDVLRMAGFDGEVSFDANRVRSYWNAYSTRKEALERLLAGLPPKRRSDLTVPLFEGAA